MPIDLYWDDEEQTALLCVFEGRWSWDELFATLKTIMQLTANIEPEIPAIIDVRKGFMLPDGLFTLNTLEQAKRLLSLNDGKTGLMLVVGVNPFIRKVFEAVATLDRSAVASVRFMETTRQARDYLQQRRQK